MAFSEVSAVKARCSGRARSVTWGVALALLAAACTPGNGDKDSSPPPPASDSSPPSPGPLEEILGWAQANDRSAGAVLAEQRRREEAVAACMAEDGFEYIPAVPELSDITVTEGPLRGSREFVESWGYGVWTSPPNAAGSVEYSVFDPNAPLLDAMSSAERAAYDEALRGRAVEESSEPGEESTSYDGGGCLDKAMGSDLEGDSGIRDEATAFILQGPQSSVFVDLNREWSICMREKGFGESSPAEAEGRVADAYAEREAEAERLTANEMEAFATEELEVSLADLNCREVLDYDSRQLALEHERQQEFVDANANDLAALN